MVVRGAVISDKSSDGIIGEGREGQKQMFFLKKVPEMVEPALHGPVEVCLFLLLCSDFLIDSGREELLLFLLEKDLKFRKEFLGCTLFVAFSECICWDSLEFATAS